MQPSDYYQPYASPPTAKQLPTFLFTAVAILLTIICAVLIFLTIAGYGTVKLINVPANASTTINGHMVQGTTIKMRPGNYQIIISSPLITPYQGVLKVKLFTTNTFHPTLAPRNMDAIASSLIGSVNSAGSPQFTQTKWFNNNTWLVGLVGPDDLDLAIDYDSATNKWSVGYYNGGGYPNSLTPLPANVANYITTLETNYAGG